MKFISATNLNRKSGGAKPRDLRCAIQVPHIYRSTNTFPLSSCRMTGVSLCPWFGTEKPSHRLDTLFSQLHAVELFYTQRIVMTHSHNDYLTVAMAPLGPGIVLGS